MEQQHYNLTKILENLILIENAIGKGSSAAKTNILESLKQEVDNDFLKFVLSTGLNKFWTTHISKIDYTECSIILEESTKFTELVSKLLSVKAVNNELRQECADYVNSFPIYLRPILTKVITKNLNIGLSASTVNKVFGENLIPDIEIMKAEDQLSIIANWFNNGLRVFAELKYDGVRLFSEIKDGKVIGIKTYNMTDLDIAKMTTIIPQLEAINHPYSHYFLDFELTNNLRQTVSGQVNKLIKGTAEVGCDKEWYANIFDIHEWSIFNNIPSTKDYITRRSLLESVIVTSGNIILSESTEVFTMDDVMRIYQEKLKLGLEGLVVKCGNGVYELKRSKLWVKLKDAKETDLRINGYFYGDKGSKLENTIAGFNCSTQDNLLNVNIGIGFTHKQLEEFTLNPDSYIGKILEVKYNSKIQDKNGCYSLFLARFKKFRPDKNSASTLGQVK